MERSHASGVPAWCTLLAVAVVLFLLMTVAGVRGQPTPSSQIAGQVAAAPGWTAGPHIFVVEGPAGGAAAYRARDGRYCKFNAPRDLERFTGLASFDDLPRMERPPAGWLFEGNCSAPSVELVSLASNGPAYGVFSVGQHIVANRRGIFLTHSSHVLLMPGAASETAATRMLRFTWHLLRIDPETLEQTRIFSATEPARIPLVESDEADNLFLLYPEFLATETAGRPQYRYRSRFLKFSASAGYRLEIDKELPEIVFSEAKYTAYYDRARRVFYYSGASYGDAFFAIKPNGEIADRHQIAKDGIRGYFEYPRMAMDDSGNLYLAWTNGRISVDPKTGRSGRLTRGFPSIHYLWSSNGGRTWRNVGSPSERVLNLPVQADDVGAAGNLIREADELFEVEVNPYRPGNFLADFAVSRGRLSFAYLSEGIPAPQGAEGVDFLRPRQYRTTQRQHFIQIDAASGRRVVDIKPQIATTGDSVYYPEGAFSRDERTGDLYYASVDAGKQLVVIKPEGAAGRFREIAKADLVVDIAHRLPIVHITTARNVTVDGYLIGTFALKKGEVEDPTYAQYFFRVKVR